jgi:RNA polymerase sigma-70 factor (ECF subfamily)
VKSSLAVFPAETRQLFDLFFEDGFTHPEIAEKTGLPLGTVKTRLRRGLITLRDQLQRLGKSNPQQAS